MFSKLHKAANQLIIAVMVILCCMIGVYVTNKEAPPLEKNHSYAILKEDFLRAIRNYDIKSAKRLYEYLKEKNPYAPFVEESAPAYLADIYLYYAKKMSFNPQAQAVFLAEAKRLAPEHPLLLSCPGCVPEDPLPAVSPILNEKAEILSEQINETEKLVAEETQAYVTELSLLDQSIESMEASHIQLEAEFYHPIRPKRTPAPGESVVDALNAHGIEYIEVRSIDINPFEPTGISREQMLFLDVYLLYCLLTPNAVLCDTNTKEWLQRLHTVAAFGRKPGLEIEFCEKKQPLQDTLLACFDEFFEIANLLDTEQTDGRYHQAVTHFYEAVKNPDKLLSSQYQAHLEKYGDFTEAGMVLAKQHKKVLTQTPLSQEKLDYFNDLVERSKQNK